MKRLVALVLLVFTLTSPLRVKAEDSPIKVGVLASLSDEWATMGQAIIRGIELALDEIHSQGDASGKKFQIVTEDTREAHSGSHAVTAYRNLRQRSITWFIGPSGTGGALALAPIVKADPILMIAPTVGVRDLSDAGSNIFNTRGIDERASEYMAQVAFKAGWRKAAVLASQQPWDTAQGEAFIREFERLGGLISTKETPLSDANDLQPMLIRMLSTKPQGVFLANYSRIGATGRQLKQLGFSGAKFSTALDSWAVESASGSLDGTEFASFSGPSDSFRKKFLSKYKAEPSLGADTAYDAMIALAKALNGSPDHHVATVAKRLLDVSFDGAAGSFSFDHQRVAKRSIKRFVIRSGRIEQVRQPTPQQ
jgi:branched-chain amino acid transport system substrate-binding protein